MTDKKFIGVVKTVQTQYGELIKISINESDFNAAKNENGWINCTLKKGKESGKHYLELDTWTPEKKNTYPTDKQIMPNGNVAFVEKVERHRPPMAEDYETELPF